MADFHSKMSVYRHELGGSTPQPPDNSNPAVTSIIFKNTIKMQLQTQFPLLKVYTPLHTSPSPSAFRLCRQRLLFLTTHTRTKSLNFKQNETVYISIFAYITYTRREITEETRSQAVARIADRTDKNCRGNVT